jgi:hypothetical protein
VVIREWLPPCFSAPNSCSLEWQTLLAPSRTSSVQSLPVSKTNWPDAFLHVVGFGSVVDWSATLNTLHDAEIADAPQTLAVIFVYKPTHHRTTSYYYFRITKPT